MSRRRTSKQDSLELLLDTICNTFGGVLFIAILVVLLLQQTGTGPAEPTPIAIPVSPVEIQSMTLRLEEVIEELERLRTNRASQDATLQTFAPEAIRQLLTTRSEAQLRQELVQTEVDQLLAANTALVARVETLGIENESVRDQLKEAQSRLQTLLAKLDTDRKSREQEARLPVTRSAGVKQEIGLVLRYGRLYVWHQYGAGNQRLGLNTDDFVVISNEREGLVTRPKPTAGVSLDGSPVSQDSVRRVLRRFSPKSCYLAVIARPDTYSGFRYLRDQAIELGFEYRLMPLNVDEPVTDRGGSGGKVQ